MTNLEVRSKFINGVQYKYSVYPLVSSHDDILSQVTSKFDFEKPPIDPTFLAISLLETMSTNWGIGLAAPQIGLPYRAFAMGSGTSGYVCFNPEILTTVGEDDFAEGCLSFKGLFLNIKRPAQIETRYQDMNGKIHQVTFDGLTARTFQHELDHLNGILYTSLVNPYHLNKAKDKIKSNIKKLQRQREAQLKEQAIQLAMKKVIDAKKVEQLNKEIALTIPTGPDLVITKT
jgi:peptide deformylase